MHRAIGIGQRQGMCEVGQTTLNRRRASVLCYYLARHDADNREGPWKKRQGLLGNLCAIKSCVLPKEHWREVPIAK